MAEIITPIIVALITSGGVTLVGLLAFFRQRKTDKVDNAEKLQRMALGMVQPLEKRLETAETDLADEIEKRRAVTHRLDIVEENFTTQTNYMHTLLNGIARLIKQIEREKLVPEWTPPPVPKMRDTGELRNKRDDTKPRQQENHANL